MLRRASYLLCRSLRVSVGGYEVRCAKNVENQRKPLVFQWFLLPGGPQNVQNSTLFHSTTPAEPGPGGFPGGPENPTWGSSWANLAVRTPSDGQLWCSECQMRVSDGQVEPPRRLRGPNLGPGDPILAMWGPILDGFGVIFGYFQQFGNASLFGVHSDAKCALIFHCNDW